MKLNKQILLKCEDECTGCGACIASCKFQAIEKKTTGFGAWVPEINYNLCVQCGLCASVCHKKISRQSCDKKAYIAYNKDLTLRMTSASGGVFSALAAYVIDHHGCVFGSEMKFVDGNAVVEHIMVTERKDLPRILGSKYVQSDCARAYIQAKKELRAGRVVLFSGCSCQINGLRNYLCGVDQSNLYTIDLVCHGVPDIELFNDYIKFLEKKNKGTIKNLYFRTKEIDKVTLELFVIFRNKIELNDKNDEDIQLRIPLRESSYYRMFMMQESYRKACYQCPYASLDKPADITIGDYFEARDDYPELFVGDDAIDCNWGLSCIISHNQKGEELLQTAIDYLYLKEVQPQVVQASHGNLHKPSKHTKARYFLGMLYSVFGYRSIEVFYHIRNKLVVFVKKIFRK